MAIPLGEMAAQPGAAPVGGPAANPVQPPQPGGAGPALGAGAPPPDLGGPPPPPGLGAPPQDLGGAAPPEGDSGEYNEEEEVLLTQLTTAAEELLYRNDAHHAAAMQMINESIKVDPAEGLASSTLMTVDQVEKKVTGFDNANGSLPMVTAEGGIPDEVFPGFAFSVYDMIWELATVQRDINLSGHVKQRGMTVLMEAIYDRDDLDETDAQYLMGGMEEEDLNSVMNVMDQGVMDQAMGQEPADTGMAATIKEAKF